MRYLLILISATICCNSLLADEGYTYDAAGRLIAVDYGNGARVRFVYDNAGNLLQQIGEPTGSAARFAARSESINAEPRAKFQETKTESIGPSCHSVGCATITNTVRRAAGKAGPSDRQLTNSRKDRAGN